MMYRLSPIIALAAFGLSAVPAFAGTNAPASNPSEASPAAGVPLEQRVAENMREHLGDKEPPQAMLDRLVQQVRNAPEQAAANRLQAEKQARELEAARSAGEVPRTSGIEPRAGVASAGDPVIQLAAATSTPKSQRVLEEMKRESRRGTRTRAQEARDCAEKARPVKAPQQGALCDPKEHQKRRAATNCVDCPEKA